MNKVNDSNRDILIKAYAEAIVEEAYYYDCRVCIPLVNIALESVVTNLQKHTNEELEKEIKDYYAHLLAVGID